MSCERIYAIAFHLANPIRDIALEGVEIVKKGAAQDLPGLDESESSQGNSICGTASKASQSMSHSRKVSLQGLQVGPGKEVSR